MIDLSQHKVDISYPCEWTYKVIGTSDNKVEKAIKEIFASKKYKLKLSNRSSKGKFVSFTLKTTVENEEERLKFFDSLTKHENINRVL